MTTILYNPCQGGETDRERLAQLLEGVRRGEVSIAQAIERLSTLPYEDLGFAKPDHHRALRRGFPEVVLGQGKSPEQIAAIAQSLAHKATPLLITRVTEEGYKLVKAGLPEAVYHPLARAITWHLTPPPPARPGISILTGGTADIAVAEEAAVTAEVMGNGVERAYDVGVAGIHRLLDQLPLLRRARVVIAVAGMEGALPSLVAGMVAAPVIAVPTSTGYGASFGGLAPLLAMLNSCSPGVAVVNIDNGFGAGYLASLINSARE